MKKTRHFIIQSSLLVFGAFFLLAGFVYLFEYTIAGVLFLLLGFLLLPWTWRTLAKRKPHLFTRRFRIIGIIVLFVVSFSIVPTDSVNQTQSVASETTTQQKESPELKVNNKAQKLISITYSQGKYIVNGSGLANTEYILKVVDGLTVKTKTNNEGTYSQELPEDVQVFGKIEQTRDTNGAWFGGKETNDTKYFVLDSQKSNLLDNTPHPIVLGIGGNSTHNISGYYFPQKTLLLKSGDTVLASIKVDKSGRYRFHDIVLSKNYTKVALYEKISTGWFSSKDEKISDDLYLDIEKISILKSLPVITKEITIAEAISFSSRTVESSTIEKGQTKVAQEGEDGERQNVYKVTYRGNDETSRELIRSDIVKQPIEKITTLGTYVYVAPAQSYTKPTTTAPQTTSTGRTGATCRDGSHSNATGRGACSHHGGVAQWLY